MLTKVGERMERRSGWQRLLVGILLSIVAAVATWVVLLLSSNLDGAPVVAIALGFWLGWMVRDRSIQAARQADPSGDHPG